MAFFTTDDGIRMYYQVAGEGAPVILLHGLTASSVFFQKQIPVFAEHCQVIAPDLRGHGQSEASNDHLTLMRLAYDLKLFLDELRIPKASFIGWSMGARSFLNTLKTTPAHQ